MTNHFESKQIHLIRYPEGTPSISDFSLVTLPLPALSDGEVIIKNKWMSVDPYMRVRMQAKKGYLPPFELNACLEGHAIGEVIESHCPTITKGTMVKHFGGWQDYCITTGDRVVPFVPQSDLSHYLGVLGMPGMTAYIGLFHYGKPQPGDTLFVSAASGAVGSLVCQLGKQQGCHIIASAGREDKIRWLQEVAGIDKVIHYKTQSIIQELPKQTPNGIDIYFDNVGGDHLKAAYDQMNPFGRIVLCGMISQYNNSHPTLAMDLFPIVSKRLTLSGFILSDHMDQEQAFMNHVLPLIKKDQIKMEQAFTEGIESAPQTFIDLLNGTYLGKVLVKLD